MSGRISRFINGESGWTDLIFRTPPNHPDARDIYLGGAGILTGVRGIFYLEGTPPQAELFKLLGPIFTITWSWIWVVAGFAVAGVTFTKHRWPEWDRMAGFALMMIWWVWGFLYLASGLFFGDDPDRRAVDLLQGLVLILTGIVLTAGVVVGIRKTQEMHLRLLAQEENSRLKLALAEITGENQRLRKEAGHADG